MSLLIHVDSSPWGCVVQSYPIPQFPSPPHSPGMFLPCRYGIYLKDNICNHDSKDRTHEEQRK